MRRSAARKQAGERLQQLFDFRFTATAQQSSVSFVDLETDMEIKSAS